MTEINKGDAGWKRRAILFLTSQCITLFGSTLVQMAVVFYVTLHTSSGAWVAACSVCSYLPQFLVSFAGGVWADRYDRKTLVMGADLAIAGVTLIMLLAIPCAGEEGTFLGALLAMSAIRSAGTGIQTPAVNAIIPGIVPHEQLMRLNGVQAAMQALVQFAAPAAAGLVLTMGGLRVTLLIDVITAGIGVGLLACVRIQKHDAGSGRHSSDFPCCSSWRSQRDHTFCHYKKQRFRHRSGPESWKGSGISDRIGQLENC